MTNNNHYDDNNHSQIMDRISTRNMVSYQMASPKTKQTLQICGLQVQDCILSSFDTFIIEYDLINKQTIDQQNRYQVYIQKVKKNQQKVKQIRSRMNDVVQNGNNNQYREQSDLIQTLKKESPDKLVQNKERELMMICENNISQYHRRLYIHQKQIRDYELSNQKGDHKLQMKEEKQQIREQNRLKTQEMVKKQKQEQSLNKRSHIMSLRQQTSTEYDCSDIEQARRKKSEREEEIKQKLRKRHSQLKAVLEKKDREQDINGLLYKIQQKMKRNEQNYEQYWKQTKDRLNESNNIKQEKQLKTLKGFQQKQEQNEYEYKYNDISLKESIGQRKQRLMEDKVGTLRNWSERHQQHKQNKKVNDRKQIQKQKMNSSLMTQSAIQHDQNRQKYYLQNKIRKETKRDLLGDLQKYNQNIEGRKYEQFVKGIEKNHQEIKINNDYLNNIKQGKSDLSYMVGLNASIKNDQVVEDYHHRRNIRNPIL